MRESIAALRSLSRSASRGLNSTMLSAVAGLVDLVEGDLGVGGVAPARACRESGPERGADAVDEVSQALVVRRGRRLRRRMLRCGRCLGRLGCGLEPGLARHRSRRRCRGGRRGRLARFGRGLRGFGDGAQAAHQLAQGLGDALAPGGENFGDLEAVERGDRLGGLLA